MKDKVFKIFNYIMELIKRIIKFIITKIKQLFGFVKNNKILIKPKNFFIKLFGYLFSVIGSLFINKNKKSENLNISKELKIIDRNILEIETQIKQKQTPVILKVYKKQLNENLNKIKNIRKKENGINKNQDQILENIKLKINECESKIKDIKKEEKVIEKNDEVKKTFIKEEIIEDNKKDIIEEKKEDIIEEKNSEKKETKILKSVNKTKIVIKSLPTKLKKKVLIPTAFVSGIVKTIISKPKKIIKKEKNIKPKENNISQSFKNNVKKINIEINKTYSKIETIKLKKQDDQELQLLILKDRILDLKKEYYNLTKKPEFGTLKVDKSILAIDPNHLMYHDKAIDDLIDYIDICIQETKARMKKNKREEKQIEKILIDSKQISMINESINKDIELSKKEITKIKNDFNNANAKSKNRILIKSLINFFKNSINIGISLLPFSIFKNKFLATLTTGILLNNRIRHMRSVTANNEDIDLMNYELIISDINDKKSCLEKTNYILEDTVNQVVNLKEELKNMYKLDFQNKSELKELLDELTEMEEDLIDENKNVTNMLDEMNGISKKTKLKIKKKNKGDI